QAPPSQGDDGHGHVRGAAAHHVVPRRGSRRDETNRGADDRRHRHVVPDGAPGLPGDLRDLEAASAAIRNRRGSRVITRADVSAPSWTLELTGAIKWSCV